MGDSRSQFDQSGESDMVWAHVRGRSPAVLTGTDGLERAGAVVGRTCRRGVLVADAAIVASGYADRAREALSASGVDRWQVEVVAPGEPTTASVDAMADAVRRAAHEAGDPVVVVGLGGGSALDTAKQAAAISAAPHGVGQYALATKPLPPRAVTLIAVPTTAGTGAEVTRTCVVSDAAGRKVWTWGDELLPDVVVLDPVATATMPAPVTAASGLDAFVHAAEAMTGRRADDAVVAPAADAARLVFAHLGPAVTNGSDLTVRLAMQEAALLAGLAIDGGGTGIAHSIGHALGTLAHVPHGVAVAVAYGAALAWNVAGTPDAFAELARAAGCSVSSLPDAYAALVDGSDLAAAVSRVGPLLLEPETLAATMIAPENRPMYENNCRRASSAERLDLARRTLRAWDELLTATSTGPP